MKYFMILILCMFSCSERDRQKYAKILADEECNLVIETPPYDNSVWFEAKGYDPITQIPKTCKTQNRWWNMFAHEMESGDTIVKKKGELIFAIHKKDTVIYHDWNVETRKK